MADETKQHWCDGGKGSTTVISGSEPAPVDLEAIVQAAVAQLLPHVEEAKAFARSTFNTQAEMATWLEEIEQRAPAPDHSVKLEAVHKTMAEVMEAHTTGLLAVKKKFAQDIDAAKGHTMDYVAKMQQEHDTFELTMKKDLGALRTMQSDLIDELGDLNSQVAVLPKELPPIPVPTKWPQWVALLLSILSALAQVYFHVH
jgi:hypothetical protein